MTRNFTSFHFLLFDRKTNTRQKRNPEQTRVQPPLIKPEKGHCCVLNPDDILLTKEHRFTPAVFLGTMETGYKELKHRQTR